MAVQEVDDVILATDSHEVVTVAKTHGFEAVMTDEGHQSGTDRIYEAATTLGLKEDEIILNVQGDEPFIEPSVVEALFHLTKTTANDDKILMNSCYKTLHLEEAMSPNMVKVVTDLNQMALYFSRSLLPYPRDEAMHEYKGHLGLYGFTMKSLRTFCTLTPAPLEHIEKLEQLRALYHGYEVAMCQVETKSFGIDTEEDLAKALEIFET
jgi:3-deoxy-manno-octulosonate cytidylyltransferase (CMP-KDO synthetase)